MLVLLERSDARLRPLFRLHRAREDEPNASSDKGDLPGLSDSGGGHPKFSMNRNKGIRGRSKPVKMTRSVSSPSSLTDDRRVKRHSENFI